MNSRYGWLNLCIVLSLLITPAAFVVSAQDSPPPEDLLTGLEALEAARSQGPEAVVALLDTLRGSALDAAMNEIRQAQEQLAIAASPWPASAAVSLAEEEAVLKANSIREAAERDLAFTFRSDPVNDAAPEPNLQVPSPSDTLLADRTVGSPPCTYSTVAAAVTAASPGDRLLLEGGVTFTANLSINKNLTIQGGYNGCGSGSSARTTLDGGGTDRVMYLYGNLTVTLENLNITHGYSAGNGAGIFVGANTQVNGLNLNIYNNTSAALGGGVRLMGGRITLNHSDIYNNTAVAGAGIYGELNSGYVPELNLQSYADVYDNQTLTGSGLGGGVYMNQGTVSITDCSDIYSNDAIVGGGAYLLTSTLTLVGECSEIQSNMATGNGGGIFAQASTINLDNLAELSSNQAGFGGGAGGGGGAYLDDSELFSDMALITHNTAQSLGGGVYAVHGSLVDMDLGGYTCTGPRCSQLSYNTALTYYGGGVYVGETSELDLRQIFVENNAAAYGGGIYAYQNSVFLYNTLLARNDATAAMGDGIRLYTGASLTGQNNTLAHNNTGGTTTGAAITMSDATLSLSNSIIWGHTTSIDLAGQTVTCSDIQGGYAGTGNLNDDPLFIDVASSNFHLQSLSPAIDRCASGQTLDFDNELRPVTYTQPASPYDMGADEASTRVGINGAACAYGRIQDAVDAAPSGATIQAEADVFNETVNISGKNLTIAGGYDVNCTALSAGATTVNGGGGGSVFDIVTSVVTLRNLQITGGSDIGAGVDLLNGSQVTFDNTDVFNNHGTYGGGVYVSTGTVLTLTNDSDIHHNNALLEGGGARVWGKLVGNDWASSISDNTAPNGGGVSVPGGELEFHGSHILRNQATDPAGLGGGLHATSNAVVTVTDSSNIAYNSAYNGGGIYSDSSSVSLSAVVHSNTAANNGGGVYLANDSTLSATNTYIGYAVSGWGSNRAINGAGLYVDSSTLDFEGFVFNNIASARGGGIYANASTINLTSARVGGTGANQANQLGTTGHEGAGLYITGGSGASITDTIVSNNIFQTTGYTYGGGAYVTGGSVVTITRSSIEHHLAPSAIDGRGAGLYISASSVTLDHSRVLSNAAGTVGGGIRLFSISTLNIINGSELHDNHATTGEGGAVIADEASVIHISNSLLHENTAGTNGGAISLRNSTLVVANCNFHDNAADNDANLSGDGGAIYSLDSSMNVAHTYLHHNHANRGGAIYQDGASAAAEVSNVLIHHNTVTTALGAGIRKNTGNFNLTQTTLSDNMGGSGFSGQANVVTNSIAWGNTAPGFTTAPLNASCNIDDGAHAGLNDNPEFVAPGAGENYHLQATSPAVDACATGSPTDLDGLPRPSGTHYDMGAFEYQYSIVYLPLVRR